MVHHPRPAQHAALQTRSRRSTLLPRQRRLPQEHRQHLLDVWPARQRRPSQLRSRQSRRRRADENDRERMGSGVRRARKYCCVRTHCDATDGGERGGCVCDDAGWREGCARDSDEAEGWAGGWGECVQGYPVGEARDGDRGGGRDFGGRESDDELR
jgi:hypothetical protein